MPPHPPPPKNKKDIYNCLDKLIKLNEFLKIYS